LKDKTRAWHIRLIWIAGLVVLTDQITKAVILNHLLVYQSIPVIPGFFSLTHIHNPGGAFGFLAGQSSTLRSIFFLFAASVAIILICYLYYHMPRTHTMLGAGLALIFGGALGNLIDRVRFGKVVDFIDFYIKDLHWPAFNIADSAISVGVAIFVFHILFKKMPAEKG